MILHPAVLGLLASSMLQSAMLLFAAWNGFRILRNWEPGSGSGRQLALERRTCLVSSVMGYVLAFQLVSLFFFLFTADRLHGMLSGAMCAAGVLNANGYGYPTLLLKVGNFLLAGAWLVVNHADSRGFDYPIIRPKYRFLLLLAPLLLLEAFLQGAFFAELKADVITSCCGSLFGANRGGVASELASWPARPAMAAFYGSVAATVLLGILFVRSGKGGWIFPLSAAVTLPVATAALVSGFCLYIYDMPTHHCPFCILQAEYRYIGYPIYAALLGGGCAGIAVAALMPFRDAGSMKAVIRPLQRSLAAAAVVLFLLFTLIVTVRVLVSPFRSASLETACGKRHQNGVREIEARKA